MIKMIAPPEGESDVQVRWLSQIEDYVVTITLNDGSAGEYYYVNHCIDETDGFLCLNVFKWQDSRLDGELIVIPAPDIDTIEVH